jgi:hypothetical protein
MSAFAFCDTHHPYDSKHLVDNAIILHGLAHPNCAGVESVECDGHWHLQHPTTAGARACAGDAEHEAMRKRRHSGGAS